MLGNGQVYMESSYGRDHRTKEVNQPRLAKPYCADFEVIGANDTLYLRALYDMSGEDGAKMLKPIAVSSLSHEDSNALTKHLIAHWNWFHNPNGRTPKQ
jgi:hypothetical protein